MDHTRTKNEIVLCNVAVADLFGEGVVAVVNVCEDMQAVQLLRDLGSIVFL